MKPVLKKTLKIVAALVAIPIVIVVLLAALLYVPPVQNWAVDQVAHYVSSSTRMTVNVDRVRLRFPLDLAVYGLRATQPNDSLYNVTDTIVDARQLNVSVRLMPLLKSNVVVDQLDFNDVRLNTAQFVPSARVKGSVGRLLLHSRSINLAKETVSVDNASLADAHLDVALSDTVPEDTTSTPTRWQIAVGKLSIERSDVKLHMPGDTLRIGTGFEQLKAERGFFDLLRGTYRLDLLQWQGGTLAYDDRYAKPVATGLDFNHIALSDIQLRLDSLLYGDGSLAVHLRQCAMKERCGLTLKELSGRVKLDTTHISLPDLRMRTPKSMLTARVDMDFSTFAQNNPGKMQVDLKGYVVKSDFAPLLSALPPALLRSMPDTPITLNADVAGNMRALNIRQLAVTYPTVFALKAHGKAQNLMSVDRLRANITADAHAYNLNFVKTLLPKSAADAFNIPADISLKGNFDVDGPRYAARFVAEQGGGKVSGDANFDSRRMAYDAKLEAQNLQLRNFIPSMPLHPFSGTLTANGVGLDFLSPRTKLTANGEVQQFGYDKYDLSDMKLTADMNNGTGRAVLQSHTPLIDGTIDLTALLNTKLVDAHLVCDLINADFQRMGLTKRPCSTSLVADVKLKSNMLSDHSVQGTVGNIIIRDSANAYRPENVFMDCFTRRDSTHAAITCGDFVLRLDGAGSIDHILSRLKATNAEVEKQRDERYIDNMLIRGSLPDVSLYANVGKDNVFSRMLKRFGYTFQSAFADLAVSRSEGINGRLSLDSLVASGVQIDTIRMAFKSDSAKTSFEGQVRNNRSNPQFVFNAQMRGAITKSSVYLGTRVFDGRERLGIALGLKADMQPGGIKLSLGGIDPVLGYKKFKVNKENYVFFAENQRISADMRLRADDGMGVQIYSNDSTESKQDLSVSLNQFDLQKVLAVVPYAPQVAGLLNGDFHWVVSDEGSMSVSSSVSVDRMAYEGSPIGNVSSEFVYMPKDKGKEHFVDGTLSMDNYEVCTLTGMYNAEGEGSINADMTLQRTPLLLLNGFVPDKLLTFMGYAQGEVKVKGSLARPEVNGELYFDSAYVASEPYGVKMRLCDDQLAINNSRMQFENFQLFARNGNALTLYGYFDFADFDRMQTYLRMRADNYLLIDSKENARSEAYGKAYVNFLGLVDGPLDALRMRGKLDVLGSSNVTYILRDSPLSTESQLDGLVKFVNFRKPETATVAKPPINGLNMDLTVNVDDGAHVLCALNPDKSNYVDLIGGGNLRMLYTAIDGLSLYGRYTIAEGEMKYSLPVIPLKTFTIKNGSYAEFSGDPMNPRLNITATEENKTTVATDGGSGRSVMFECGVEITKTLQDMGLQFIIDAPDDQQMHNELMTQSVENRGKLAVTMLTTGMYLSDNNLGSLSVNSALSSFLSSQINSISGSALRTLDLSFGMDNTTLGTGEVHTDYSFKFSKRLWNNRLRIVIGGKVSTGAEVENQNDTFFDNVTLEYRLSPTSNKYLKLFYDRDSYDWLEGYVEQFGGGFVWRRKLRHFKDIFRFGKEKPEVADTIINKK